MDIFSSQKILSILSSQVTIILISFIAGLSGNLISTHIENKQDNHTTASQKITNYNYNHMLFYLGLEIGIGTIFLSIFLYLDIAKKYSPPLFWGKGADTIALIEIFFFLFVFLILILEKLDSMKKILQCKKSRYIFYILGASQIVILSLLIEKTYGLMLSPFSEFYALILLTVLILAKSITRSVLIFTPIILCCITRNFLLDSNNHNISNLINVSWHRWHGFIFLSILIFLFIVDLRKDKRILAINGSSN